MEKGARMPELNERQRRIQENLVAQGYEVTWIQGGYTTDPCLYDDSPEAEELKADRKSALKAG